MTHASERRLARCRLALAIAGRVHRVRPASLVARRRGRRVVRARQLAIYLAHVTFGVPRRETALAFCRHRTSIQAACARVETARDLPRFERSLQGLETAAGLWSATFLGDDR